MFLIPNNTFEERISKADGVSIMKVNQLTWRAICQRSVSVTRAHTHYSSSQTTTSSTRMTAEHDRFEETKIMTKVC